MNYFSRLPQDIILSYILPRLDGETLIALSSVSSEFFHLICKNNNNDLWRNICISKWPSLLSCRPIVLSTMISMFSGGYRSFFSAAFPSIHHRNTAPPPPPPLPPVYISHMPLIYFYRENKNRNLCMEKFKNNKST
ncbi:F-box protein [Trifolium repens]|nr:F-box protein [Trifolium repens]